LLHLLDSLKNTGRRIGNCNLNQQRKDCEDDGDLEEHVDEVLSDRWRKVFAAAELKTGSKECWSRRSVRLDDVKPVR
jgi:hypothetical protein